MFLCLAVCATDCPMPILSFCCSCYSRHQDGNISQASFSLVTLVRFSRNSGVGLLEKRLLSLRFLPVFWRHDWKKVWMVAARQLQNWRQVLRTAEQDEGVGSLLTLGVVVLDCLPLNFFHETNTPPPSTTILCKQIRFLVSLISTWMHS